MPTPASPEHGAIHDLSVVAAELLREPAYAREGHTARTLVRTSDLRVVLIAIQAGKRISEHHANVTASVHTLTGQIRLQLADRNVDLPAGQVLVLGSGLQHDVYAETDSLFMLTLGWRAA